MESQMEISSSIILVIVMLALFFVIVNTMLMAILERIKELGILMGIGLKRSQVFIMIVLETMLLGLISAPVGLLLALLTIQFTSTSGIDLSAYSAGVEQFGMA